MSAKHLSLNPHKARADDGLEAWWYENIDSIDVYIRNPDSGALMTARITCYALKKAIERMEKK